MKVKQALDGTRLNAFAMNPSDLVVIGLDTEDNERHPLYDPRIRLPIDESMVKNIMVYGVLEPIIVRKNGDSAEVVDGRQRVRCAREANAILYREGKEPVKVPCIVKRGDDARLLSVSISANEQRKDDDMLTRAAKVQRYLDMGRSEEEAGLAFGVSTQTIKNWVKLLDLSEEVQRAVRSGEISPHAAMQLSSVPEAQQAKVIEQAKQKKPSTRKKVSAKDVSDKPMAPSRRLLRLIASQSGKVRRQYDGGFVAGVRYALGLDTKLPEDLKKLSKTPGTSKRDGG